MAERRLLYIDAEGDAAEHETTDKIRLSGIGIDVAAPDNGLSVDGTSGANIALTGSARITGVPDTPTANTDAVNANYVIDRLNGLSIKASCRVATTAVMTGWTASGSKVGKTLTSPTTATSNNDFDSVTVALDDRVLVKNGPSNVDNGIYVVTQLADGASDSCILTRATDCDEDDEFFDGITTWVGQGTTLQDSRWSVYTNDAITVDTTANLWTQTGGSGSYTEGNGIDISGSSVISVDIHTATDGTGITLADTDEVLAADADDSWAVKRVSMSQIQDYVSSAGVDNDLTDGNGIVDFTYNGSAAASVTVDPNDSADPGSSAANVIEVTASGVGVVGLPAQFKLNGSQVSANVTQTNVDELVDGVASAAAFHDASALHAHNQIMETYNADTNGVTANYAVRFTGNSVIENGEADSAAGARVIGVSLDTASVGNPARVVFAGPAAGVLSGATAGAQYFVDDAGALTTTLASGNSRRVIRVGYAINATDLFVQVQRIGVRAAA